MNVFRIYRAHLIGVPLEYGQRAVAWLLERREVGGHRIGVVGSSRGGELALLGSRLGEIGAVVAICASPVVWPGQQPGEAGGPPWCENGAGLP